MTGTHRIGGLAVGLAVGLVACGGRTAPGAWWITNDNQNNGNVNANRNTNTNVARCGNGFCELGEAPYNCPQDCPGDTFCGDGICDIGETSVTCPEDCTFCGDGVCEARETPQICPNDCFGDRSCQGVLLCTFCCDPGDTQCEQACQNRGTAHARAEWNTFRSCTLAGCDQECLGGLSPQCIMCGMEVCNDDCGYGETGTANCNVTINCLAGCSSIETGGTAEVCNDDPGVQCHDGCFRSADHEAVLLYDTWVRCLVDACGDQCDPVADARGCIDCALQFCAYEMNDCHNDDGAP